jgi:hypothetical protein
MKRFVANLYHIFMIRLLKKQERALILRQLRGEFYLKAADRLVCLQIYTHCKKLIQNKYMTESKVINILQRTVLVVGIASQLIIIGFIFYSIYCNTVKN